MEQITDQKSDSWPKPIEFKWGHSDCKNKTFESKYKCWWTESRRYWELGLKRAAKQDEKKKITGCPSTKSDRSQQYAP